MNPMFNLHFLYRLILQRNHQRIVFYNNVQEISLETTVVVHHQRPALTIELYAVLAIVHLAFSALS